MLRITDDDNGAVTVFQHNLKIQSVIAVFLRPQNVPLSTIYRKFHYFS